MRSVLLYSKKPVSEIETVVLDQSSRTSAALLKILFARCFQLKPSYLEGRPPLAGMLQNADAALIIGDSALQTPGGNLYQMDLSEEWLSMTGQPFVFAFFAARPCKHLEETWQTLLQAKALGIREIPLIARQEAMRLGLDYSVCLDYLTRRIHYDLAPDKLAGLRRFYQLAGISNLIRKDVMLKFYRSNKDINLLALRWKLANV